jgi:long-chain acyl-CoA synthetase
VCHRVHDLNSQSISNVHECRPDDVFLSYLPLAHIFDRVAEELFLAISARIGYWQGSPKTLMDDVGTLRPTIFVGVPRIFDRIYTGVTDKVCLRHCWRA